MGATARQETTAVALNWLIERNSPIGKLVPDAVKKHPWNLNPASKRFHNELHAMGSISRTVLGAPKWAQAAGTSAAVGGLAEVIDGECGCD